MEESAVTNGVHTKSAVLVLDGWNQKNTFHHLESGCALKTLDFPLFDPMKWSETCSL